MYNQFFTIKPRISEKRRKQSCTPNINRCRKVLGSHLCRTDKARKKQANFAEIHAWVDIVTGIVKQQTREALKSICNLSMEKRLCDTVNKF